MDTGRLAAEGEMFTDLKMKQRFNKDSLPGSFHAIWFTPDLLKSCEIIKSVRACGRGPRLP